MSELKITLDDHPTKCIYKSGPLAGQQVLINEKPVPLIKDQYAIRMNGVMVGYCSKNPNGFISIFDHSIEPAIKDVIVEYVSQNRSDTGGASISQTPIIPADDSEEFEDEDE